MRSPRRRSKVGFALAFRPQGSSRLCRYSCPFHHKSASKQGNMDSGPSSFRLLSGIGLYLPVLRMLAPVKTNADAHAELGSRYRCLLP